MVLETEPMWNDVLAVTGVPACLSAKPKPSLHNVSLPSTRVTIRPTVPAAAIILGTSACSVETTEA